MAIDVDRAICRAWGIEPLPRGRARRSLEEIKRRRLRWALVANALVALAWIVAPPPLPTTTEPPVEDRAPLPTLTVHLPWNGTSCYDVEELRAFYETHDFIEVMLEVGTTRARLAQTRDTESGVPRPETSTVYFYERNARPQRWGDFVSIVDKAMASGVPVTVMLGENRE
jgi:hypothetical protein